MQSFVEFGREYAAAGQPKNILTPDFLAIVNKAVDTMYHEG